MKKLYVMFMAAALSACSLSPGFDPGSGAPPAPLEQTQIDERGIILAWQAFDALLYTIDALRDTGVLIPGTPRADTIAHHIIAARNWLNVATEAQRLGQQETYVGAAEQAQAALLAIRAALEKSP